jgi:hypothetical protein
MSKLTGPRYWPETNTVTGADGLVLSEHPRYIELLTNPACYDGEWRALANVDQSLRVVVVSLNGLPKGIDKCQPKN